MATRGLGLLIAAGVGLAVLASSSSSSGPATSPPPPPGAPPPGGWSREQCIAGWLDYLAREFDRETDPAKLTTAAADFREMGWHDAATCTEAKASGAAVSCYAFLFADLRRDFDDSPDGLRAAAEFARAYGLAQVADCLESYANTSSVSL